MLRRCCAILPVPALLLASAIASADAPTDRERLLEARRAQLAQKRERQFRDADTDADRGLSREELRASSLPPALLRRFAEIDRDGDDRLSAEELQALDRRAAAAATSPAAPEIPVE